MRDLWRSCGEWACCGERACPALGCEAALAFLQHLRALRFYDCCAAERGASPLTTKKRGPAFSDGLLLGVVAIVGVGQG